jgi:hypothetical protein
VQKVSNNRSKAASNKLSQKWVVVKLKYQTKYDTEIQHKKKAADHQES